VKLRKHEKRARKEEDEYCSTSLKSTKKKGRAHLNKRTLVAIKMDDTTCNCQWCMLFGKKEEALPSCDTTFLVPISYLDDDALNKLVDWETVLSPYGRKRSVVRHHLFDL